MLKGIKVGTRVRTKVGTILEFAEFHDAYTDYKYIFNDVQTNSRYSFIETGEIIGPDHPSPFDIVEILIPIQERFKCIEIDYEGCDPDIKEALTNGYYIECGISDESIEDALSRSVGTSLIVAYCKNSQEKYITPNGIGWEYAVPIKRSRKIILPPEEAIPILIKNGFSYNKYGELYSQSECITKAMFQYMGKPFEGVASSWEWPSCIIKEI